MGKYAAFLRGINISGKNKICMSDLKAEFEALGFSNVSTYQNSGNVVFDTDTVDAKHMIEKMICDKFGLNIPVFTITIEKLRDILAHSPAWWGTADNDKYDNLIFILSSDTAQEIFELIGPPSEELEVVQVYNDIIFWTFDRKKYQKCRWWKKTAAPDIADKLTIRTASTIKKVCK